MSIMRAPFASTTSLTRGKLLTRLPDIDATGPPEYLEAAGIPLVGGLKRFPVRFTPTAPVGK